MIERWIEWYNHILTGTGMSDTMVVFLENASIIVFTIGLAALADFIVKRIIIATIHKVA